MKRNYLTNSYRSLRENARYRGKTLNESVYDEAFMEEFKARFGEEGTKGDLAFKGQMNSLAKALGIASTIIKRQNAEEQVEIIEAFLVVFGDEVGKNAAKRILKRSLKQGSYESSPHEEEPMEKMENRYRSGSRLNESRRSVQRPNRRYNY